ncbi:hypothetical protein Tco_0347703 [Tanacetum coccineum]
MRVSHDLRVLSKAHREGVGIRVADSHAGNHPEGCQGHPSQEITDHIRCPFGLRWEDADIPKALHNPITYLGNWKGVLCLEGLMSVNNNAPVIDATPLSSIYPSNVVENVADSDDPSYKEDEQTLIGPSLSPQPKASKKIKFLGKRKVVSDAPGKALPLKVQKVPAQASKVAGEASTPLDVDSDSDINDLDKNPLVSDMRAEIKDLQGQVDGLHSIESERERLKSFEIKLLQEIDSLKQDRADVVSKVIIDATIKLIRSDDLGVLIAKIVRSSIIYGRCQAFEEVAAMEGPFVLEKMSGYRPSSKEEYDQSGDALANTSYPFLAEYVVDPYASLEQLLSKKPPLL